MNRVRLISGRREIQHDLVFISYDFVVYRKFDYYDLLLFIYTTKHTFVYNSKNRIVRGYH